MTNDLYTIIDGIKTALTNLMDRWMDEYRYEKKQLPEYGKALQQCLPADVKVFRVDAVGKSKLRFICQKGKELEFLVIQRKGRTQEIYTAGCVVS